MVSLFKSLFLLLQVSFAQTVSSVLVFSLSVPNNTHQIEENDKNLEDQFTSTLRDLVYFLFLWIIRQMWMILLSYWYLLKLSTLSLILCKGSHIIIFLRSPNAITAGKIYRFLGCVSSHSVVWLCFNIVLFIKKSLPRCYLFHRRLWN